MVGMDSERQLGSKQEQSFARQLFGKHLQSHTDFARLGSGQPVLDITLPFTKTIRNTPTGFLGDRLVGNTRIQTCPTLNVTGQGTT